jgi:hypothetical protein
MASSVSLPGPGRITHLPEKPVAVSDGIVPGYSYGIAGDFHPTSFEICEEQYITDWGKCQLKTTGIAAILSFKKGIFQNQETLQIDNLEGFTSVTP